MIKIKYYKKNDKEIIYMALFDTYEDFGYWCIQNYFDIKIIDIVDNC